MPERTFDELFNGYMSGTLNAEELRQFRVMALMPENRERLSGLLQDAFNDPAYAEHADYDTDEMAGEVVRKAKKADEMLSVLKQDRISLLERPWFKYAAAAAVFVLLIGATWQFHLYKQRNRPLLASHSVVKPAAPQPVLILGDGSRIALDSVANGTIAHQGGAQVVKLANGQVAYNAGTDDKGGAVFNTMQTPNGCLYQLTLPDGSKVWLNAASAIRYPTVFPSDSRLVEVTGEVYFEVAKDERRPFVVSARGMQVKVLGTAFNVMAYPDEGAVKTTLVEGMVKVNADKLLHPGEQAVLNSHSGQLTVNKPDMAETLGWKNGEFYFRDTDITTIMRQIARWYDVEVKYEGDMSDIVLSGIVARTAQVSQLLKALELTKIVRFKIQGKTIIVMPYQAAH